MSLDVDVVSPGSPRSVLPYSKQSNSEYRSSFLAAWSSSTEGERLSSAFCAELDSLLNRGANPQRLSTARRFSVSGVPVTGQ